MLHFISRCHVLLVLLAAVYLLPEIALGAQIKIAWDPNTEADLSGYKIYYGTTTGNYGAPIDAGNVTTYTVSGLTEGQTHFIAVTAYDTSNNESGYSNEVSGTATVPVQSYTVTTNPSGLQVDVDGTTYTSPQMFNWQVGSSHTLSVNSPQNGASGVRYAYSFWGDGGGQSHSITMPSSGTAYSASFTTQYTLTTSGSPSGGGSVGPSGTNWHDSGQRVWVTATPNMGYSFGSWSGVVTGTANPVSVTMSGPGSLAANFSQNQYTLTVSASPSGSGPVTKSPNKATYVYGDSVTLTGSAAAGYQFSNWSGSATGTANPYELTINSNKAVTANFTAIPETVSTPTSPTGPSSGITGTSYGYATGGSISNLGHSVEYQFDWKGDGSDLSSWGSSAQSKPWTAVGSYSVRARARCVSHTGVVSSWSSSFSVVISAAPVSCTVATSPSGLQVTVDGSSYTAPYAFNWVPGTSHTVSVNSPQNGPSGTRYIYASWGDGGGQSHTVTVPSSGTAYTASFTTQHTLTTSVSPSGGGSVSPSGASWSDSGQAVLVSATPNTGYSFSNWSGDLSGATNPASVTMGGPKSVTANFTAIPEAVSTPTKPTGPSSGMTGTSYGYATGGSISNLGHSVEYQFDWKGDGSDLSSWGSSSQSKTWTAAGSYSVRARARCVSHTGVVSSWSSPFSVVISAAPVSCTVATSPSGLQVTVDGSSYTAPYAFNWVPGTSHTVSVNSPQNGPSGTRYVYASWGDGGRQSHTVTVPSSGTAYTASFTTQHTLTTSVSSSGAGSVSPSGASWNDSGQAVPVSATPNTGYSFSNWSGDLSGATNPASVTMGGPKSVTANFTDIPETISIPTTPAGSSSGMTGTSYGYATGGSISNLGHSVEYQFDWKGDGSDPSSWGSSTQSKTWTVAGSYSVRARARCVSHTGVVSSWSSSFSVVISAAPVSCTVATSPSGLQVTVDGSSYTAPYAFNWVPGTSHTVSVSSPQNGPSGTRYVYASWGDGGGQSHTVTVPSSGTAYTASFTTQYTLTASVNPSGAGSVSPSGANWSDSGQAVPVSATPNTGYSFSNWSGDLSVATNPASVTMGGPKSVTANFIRNQYTLSVSESPSGSGSVAKTPDKTTYVYGDSVTLSASANAGYSFSGWSGDGSGVNNPYVLTINSNKAVTANFTAILETVSIPTTPAGSSSGMTGTSYGYATGGSISNLGHSVEYQFDWKGDGSDPSSWGSSTQSKTWTAVGSYSVRARARCVSHTGVVSSWSSSFSVVISAAPVSCTVATSPSGLQVTVDGSSYTAPYAFNWVPGTSHTVSVNSPQSGPSGTRYVYASWGDGGGQSHTVTVPSSGTAYTAFFTTQHTLTTSVSPSGAGSVSPSGANWSDSGQAVPVSATPNTGYSFSNWSGDLSGATNPASVTMGGPKNITANFTQNQYTLSVSESPSGSGSVAKTPDKTTYVYGDSVTLTASANAGYHFTGWSGDAIGTTSPYTLTIDGNKVVTANLTPIPEVVSTPGSPSGPSKGVAGTTYTYSSGGSASDQGDPVEYQFDWNGDGTDLSPWGSTSRSKAWTYPGTYPVRVRARCATHPGVLSPWSPSLSVLIKKVPAIRLATPNGGEVFKIGSTQKLSWVSEDLDSSGKIALFYYKDNDWQKITELPPYAKSYYWIVPNTPMPATFMRIGNWVGGDWECLDSTKTFFTISSTGGAFVEGGWVFDILKTDQGGAVIWFEDNKLVGYGLSFGYGLLGIEGTYEMGEKGILSGSYGLYDFDHATERERGSFTAKTDKKGTKLTMVLQTSGGEPSSLIMKGRLLLSDPAIPETWAVEMKGGRKGRLDPLRIEQYQVEGQVYPRFYRVSGPGFIPDAGSIEINGYFILTSKNITHGIYEMNGAISETGVFSGKLDPVSGKFKLKAVSDEGVNYTQSGVVKP